MDVAQAAFAAACQANSLAVLREVGHDFAGVGIADQCAYGHLQLDIVGAGTVAVGAVAFFTVLRLIAFYETVFH